MDIAIKTDYVRANDLMEKAKNAERHSYFRSPDYFTAASFYERAAVNFKIADDLKSAAAAYIEAARCRLNFDGRKSLIADNYKSACEILFELNEPKIVDILKKSIEIYLDEGSLYSAGNCRTMIGKFLMKNNRTDDAISEYKLAEKYFKCCGSHLDAVECSKIIANAEK